MRTARSSVRIVLILLVHLAKTLWAGRSSVVGLAARKWYANHSPHYVGDLLPVFRKFDHSRDHKFEDHFEPHFAKLTHIEKLWCRTGNRIDYFETSYSTICTVTEPLVLGYGGTGGSDTNYLYPESRRLVHLQAQTCIGKWKTYQVCKLLIFTDLAYSFMRTKSVPIEYLYLQCGKPHWNILDPPDDIITWTANSTETLRYVRGAYGRKGVYALGFVAGQPVARKDCPRRQT